MEIADEHLGIIQETLDDYRRWFDEHTTGCRHGGFSETSLPVLSWES